MRQAAGGRGACIHGVHRGLGARRRCTSGWGRQALTRKACGSSSVPPQTKPLLLRPTGFQTPSTSQPRPASVQGGRNKEVVFYQGISDISRENGLHALAKQRPRTKNMQAPLTVPSRRAAKPSTCATSSASTGFAVKITIPNPLPNLHVLQIRIFLVSLQRNNICFETHYSISGVLYE